MDKNQIIGFILIFAVLLGWTIMSAPSKEELAAQTEQVRQDSILQAEQLAIQNKIDQATTSDNTTPTNPTPNDADAVEKLKYSYGSFAEAAIGNEKEIVLENAEVKLTFSTKGGFIKEALLKKYKKVLTGEDGEDTKGPLSLLEDKKNVFSYNLPLNGPLATLETKDLFFIPNKSGNSLSMTVSGNNGEVFTQTYTLADEGYHLDYDLSYNGLKSGAPIQVTWVNYLDKLEKNVQFEQRYSTVYYKDKEDDDTDYCGCASDDTEDLSSTTLSWISHSNQFFNSTLIADEASFSSSILSTQMLPLENEDLKIVKSDFAIEDNGGKFDMSLYIGPNEYDELIKYENDLEEIIPFGNSIFGTINRHFIRPFFNFLSKYIGSKGVVIIFLIFIIKMALYPLMYKMLHSQAKMGALKPELAKLKEKLKDEPQKQQMEQMKVYREYGVSPLGGCLPMVLQMPIWYALFRFFPASIIFRQEPFLWADDLSSYDVITMLPYEIPFMGDHLSLFTILWAISTVAYTYYNTKHMDLSANPAMKYVQYFMPIMFLAFFNSYASGLTCYMLFSNLFNILQTVVTKQFVFNDDKIRAELMKNKEKPKKKSGFQSRLEEAMKKQQTTAQQQKTNKKKK